MAEAPDYRIDFDPKETLFVGIDWIEQHCVVPDSFDAGDPFELGPWQLFAMANHYRVKRTAKWKPERPMLATAFVNRRSQVVLPQKAGKAPFTASQICLEAVGPALFAGWAEGGETWDCRDHGCGCGWVYEYEPGEAMGMAWPTPLIQVTATSEEQTDNIYDALRPMIDKGPLSLLIPKTGEEFIRLPNDGRIDVVTSSATSRLGQRVTFVPQDETGVWTPENKMVKVAETQRRGLAGMGGRSTETTNGWDPTQDSVAKRTAESKAKDIFRLHPLAPAELDYTKKVDRARIHRFVYHGSPWVDLDAIEAEAAELLEVDPMQAERFFGNRCPSGSGVAFDLERWQALALDFEVPERALIVVGFDGARFFDSTALIATHIESGYQWPLGIWERPDGLRLQDEWEIPESEVTETLVSAFDLYRPFLIYADPPHWSETVDHWAGRFGEKRVKRWHTARVRPMAFSLRNYRTAMHTGIEPGEARVLSHDGDERFAAHIGNARRRNETAKDDEGLPLWTIRKETPKSPLKIDAAMAGCLSWEARGDAIAAGALRSRSRVAYF